MNSSAEAVLAKVRQALERRGAKTIRSLGKVFRELDSYDGNKKVDADEFFIGLKELGVELTKAESGVLLNALDTNGDGCVDFDEFLIGIRGQMNATRQAIVDKAFQKFDRDGSGEVNAADLKGVYDASKHPKVISGEMTPDEVFLEFLQSFGGDKDGIITKKEWDHYYSAVSASVDNDDYFLELMTQCWKL
eukprot:CAMPEP_0176430518 /NCGR_PEP_ID=MMETSP0127-20121128/14299_1 /TAXON_ID=938130 /ORGANISM="Platyophrya macrostoma, Strain WH" /LENGTH=190 /DNA_ID=CAMNT_0017812419 /DNA_START=34 /DNA_END=606 /DNA_ORIENTATION=-